MARNFYANEPMVHDISRLQDVLLRFDAVENKEEVLQLLPSIASQYLDFQYMFLIQANFKRSHYHVSVLFPDGMTLDIDRRHFPIDAGMPGWVMKHKTPVAVEIDVAPETDPNFEGYLAGKGAVSLLLSPLQTADENLGVIGFASNRKRGFTESDFPIAVLLGTQTAIVFRNIRIRDEQRRRLSQLELINKIAQRIISTLDLNELLSSAAENIQRDFSYFDVTIFLLDKEKEFLNLVAHSGNYIDFLPHGYRQHISTGIIGWTAAHNQAVLLNDVSLDDRYLTYAYHNTNSELSVPICFNNEVFGVINIEDTRLNAFDELDMIVIETLADQLGSALRNARLYEQIKLSNEKLTKLDKMKTEFLSIVSHDFRSPLSSIILAVKSLVKNSQVKANKHVVEYLTVIEEQAQRLSFLAEEILSITRMEAGKLTYNFKVVNLQTLTENAIALVKFSQKHKLNLNIDESISYIKADESKIRQVIHNLLSNAVKYSPNGGDVCVVIKEYFNECILFSVTDRGIGIPKDKSDLLFKKFGRVNCDKTMHIKGSGLGLWISKEIVQAHGGFIWYESDPGKKTTFYFTIKKTQ